MERRLSWRRWWVVVATGELLGFLLPAVAGVLGRDLGAATQLLIAPAAGLAEGALLGLAQAVVLRPVWPSFRTGPWVLATSLAAALAWFLGMLPSTTHDTWTRWPAVWVVVVGVSLGSLLLASIGAAQALAMPPGTRGRLAWMGWTALGWVAGLGAFTAVAPPLWHEHQAVWAAIVVGLAGGLAMALVMAAVTGVGAVRLVGRAREPRSPFGVGTQPVSAVLGAPVHDAAHHRIGRVRDLVIDLATSAERPQVTGVLVRLRGGRRALVPWDSLDPTTVAGGHVSDSRPAPASLPTQLLVRRDVLDSPVVLADPPRRGRVSDVVLEIDAGGARVLGLDLSTAGALRRLVRRPLTADHEPSVPLSHVLLASPHGHAAQLAAPGSSGLLRLPPETLAEVLTRVSTAHARDIVRAVDWGARDRALRLLHPHVRRRVLGSEGPPRRSRRLDGWRLRPPGRQPPGGDVS